VSWLFLLYLLLHDGHPRLGAFLLWLDRPSLYDAAVQGGRAAPHIGHAVRPCLTATLPSSSRLKYALCYAMDWFWSVILFGLDLASAGRAGRAGRQRSAVR